MASQYLCPDTQDKNTFVLHLCPARPDRPAEARSWQLKPSCRGPGPRQRCQRPQPGVTRARTGTTLGTADRRTPRYCPFSAARRESKDRQRESKQCHNQTTTHCCLCHEAGAPGGRADATATHTGPGQTGTR